MSGGNTVVFVTTQDNKISEEEFLFSSDFPREHAVVLHIEQEKDLYDAFNGVYEVQEDGKEMMLVPPVFASREMVCVDANLPSRILAFFLIRAMNWEFELAMWDRERFYKLHF